MEYDITAINSVPSVGAASQHDGRTRVDGATSARGRTTTDAASERKNEPDATKKDDDAKTAASELADALATYNVSLQFSRDQDTGAIVVKLFDATSGEQLRQIPDAAALKLSTEFEKLQGRLFSRRA